MNTNLGTGMAVGQFVFGVRDGVDPGDEPEVIPAQGTVTITPNIAQSAAVAAVPNPMIMWLTPTELILDEQGYACLPDPNDATRPGKGGVRLFANDDPKIGVKNWNYTVTVNLRSADGKFLGTMDPFQIFVPTGAGDSPENPAVDMANFAPIPASVGIGSTQAVMLIAKAESIAADVQRRADSGEFKGEQGPGYTIPAMQLADKDDTPVVTFAPVEIWAGKPNIIGSAGWFREKRVDAGERAAGQQQGDGKPLDIQGSSYFRYPALLTGSDWANNSGRIAISNVKPGGDAQYAYELFNLEFVTSSSQVEIMVNVGTTKGSIGTVLVNGKRISERDIRHTGTQGEGMGIMLTFPSAKERTIRIYGLNNGTGRFGGVAVRSGYTVVKPKVRPARRFAFIGDSFVNGTDQVTGTETFVWRLADLMGADEVLQMGIGGTGFASGDAATRFDKRVAAVLAYDPDVIFFAGGRNDAASAELQGAISATLALAGQGKETYLVSTASDASQPAVNDALAAAAAASGVPFIRANVDAFPREDAVHLTYEGHQSFADELFSKIVSSKLDPVPVVTAIAKETANTASQLQTPLSFRGPLGILRAALALMGSGNPAIGNTVNIGFMGSSTTAGHTTEAGKRWVDLLAAKVTSNPVLTDLEAYNRRTSMPSGINFINAATNGATTANYVQGSRGDRLASVKPRLIVHTVGANDFYNNYTVEQFRTNLVAAIDYMDKQVGAPLAHLLVHSYERYDMNPASPAGRAQWNDFRDVMISVAQERPASVAFLDVSETFRGVGIPKTDPLGLMMSDKVHMNDYGHRLYADIIGSALGLTGAASSIAPVVPPVVRDDFDRANGPLGSTPVGGRAWAALSGEMAVLDGRAVAVTLNAVAGTPTGAGASVDTGLTDCVITAKYAKVGSQGILFRATPEGAGYYFMWSVAGNEYRIGKRNATSGFTKMVGTGTALTFNSTATLAVELHGASIIAKVDGQKVLEATDTTFSSPNHGLVFAETVGQIDSFQVDKLPAA